MWDLQNKIVHKFLNVKYIFFVNLPYGNTLISLRLSVKEKQKKMIFYFQVQGFHYKNKFNFSNLLITYHYMFLRSYNKKLE